MAVSTSVVGLCGYKRLPSDRSVEIGYGVAPERLLLEEARADDEVDELVAETAVDNAASGRVLERNGFMRVGLRDSFEDGPLDLWRYDLSVPEQELRP